MEVYDIRAHDNSGGIVLRVHNGDSHIYVNPDMAFYMEVVSEDEEALEELVSSYGLSDEIELIDRGWDDVDNRQTVSVEYKTLAAKEKLKNVCEGHGIELFNADIPEELLWILENGHIRGNIMRKPLFFDIEVDPTGFAYWDQQEEEDKYQNRIYCIGAMDTNGIKRFFIDKDETMILKKFYAFAMNYTCISGWNSFKFDVPYIEGRTKRLGLKLDWRRIPQIDMMFSYGDYREKTKELGEVIYKSLDRVSTDYLGAGKVDIGGPKGIKKAWEEDWLALEIYCMHDVELLYELFYKIKGIKDLMEIEASKVQLGYLEPNRRYISSFIDNIFTKLALESRMAIPQMDRWQHRDSDAIRTKGAGGFVPKPIIGLHFNTVGIDFEALYPSIFMTHNNGINTVDWDREDEDAILSEELQFHKYPRGLNARFMEYMLKTRRKYRNARDEFDKGTVEYDDLDIKQNTFKLLLVAANGVLQEKKFRYKNQAVYNSITKTGQVYLKLLIEAGNKLGWKLLCGHTDGCYFTTPYETIEEIVEALPSAEKFIYDYVREKAQERWNIPDEYYAIRPRCEHICSHFYCMNRTSYVGKVIWDDGKYLAKPWFEAKGMPGVKYNTLPLLKEILKNVFKKVIFGVNPGEDYVPLVVDYLLSCRDDLFSGRRDDWLTFAQRVDKLEGRLPHNRAANILAEQGLFEPGMIIRFIRRANGSLILPDYEEKFEIDRRTYNYYWQGTVANWMKKLLPEVVGDRSLGFREAAETKTLDW